MRALLLLGLGCLLATPSAATEVRVPMQVDFAFLRGLLIERAYTDPTTPRRSTRTGSAATA